MVERGIVGTVDVRGDDVADLDRYWWSKVGQWRFEMEGSLEGKSRSAMMGGGGGGGGTRQTYCCIKQPTRNVFARIRCFGKPRHCGTYVSRFLPGDKWQDIRDNGVTVRITQ